MDNYTGEVDIMSTAPLPNSSNAVESARARKHPSKQLDALPSTFFILITQNRYCFALVWGRQGGLGGKRLFDDLIHLKLRNRVAANSSDLNVTSKAPFLERCYN